jgi:tRNA (guanine37-N1)-methyltransferase
VDERVIEEIVDEEVSIGDFVLTGGELPALMVADAVARMLPGVLSCEESFINESHYSGLLEYPQYTRPPEFMGRAVPEVLQNGHHAKIEKWRREASLCRTFERRPDMLVNAQLSKNDAEYIAKLAAEKAVK